MLGVVHHTKVFVSIGSNIERERNVRSAVHALNARFPGLIVSPVYASAALGFEGDEFYNLVVAFHTELSLEALDAEFDAMEAAHGRQCLAKRLTSRTLDLDLLTYGDQVVDRPGLRLPRPDILRFAFVLKPLADIAPFARHPVLDETYQALWAAFPSREQALRRVEMDFS